MDCAEAAFKLGYTSKECLGKFNYILKIGFSGRYAGSFIIIYHSNMIGR